MNLKDERREREDRASEIQWRLTATLRDRIKRWKIDTSRGSANYESCEVTASYRGATVTFWVPLEMPDEDLEEIEEWLRKCRLHLPSMILTEMD